MCGVPSVQADPPIEASFAGFVDAPPDSVLSKDARIQWISESAFPIKKQQVQRELELRGCSVSRTGWYYQQLLKLLAPEAIESISEPYVVVDSDVVFLDTVQFTLDDGQSAVYPMGDDHHAPYFAHMHRLTGGLVTRYYPEVSGMCHFMVFHKVVLKSLFQLVESTIHLPFWQAFLRCVDADDSYMGASEYELYFNYIMRWHPERVCLQRVRWKNAPATSLNSEADARQGFKFVAYHTQYDNMGRRRTDNMGTADEEWSVQGGAAERSRASRFG
eukprot:CAMPEP_0114259432 /NCGR_PEP_ID=MMETSP0058-20121206/19890_1 /TAXON_ID=36894 /ORGANISM="Pyramimonas parkeae, CCMP726" /LENGTH=273 /DNA_ID=CAMNT_0001374479 /DNA_START=212 /DNA_END=1034 /DNA_ORIENTATION=-